MKKGWIALVSLCLLGQFAGVEARTWRAKNGKAVEGDFVRLFGDKVVLKLGNGKTVKVPIKGLCAEDQKYLATIVPPKIKLTVRHKTSNSHKAENVDFKQVSEQMKMKIHLQKTNREPCTKTFTVHVVAVGKAIKGYDRIVVANEERSFSFASQNVFKFDFTTHALSWRDSWSGKAGYTFEGELVWVEDENGKIVFIEGNPGMYESRLGKIRDLSVGTKIDRDFNSAGESETWSGGYFDSDY